MVFPEGTKDNPQTEGLILSLFGVAGQHDLKLEIKTGDCISPISVSGDLEVEQAEEIKQEALGYVEKWGFAKE
jgi:hypothetical protein